MADAAQKYEEVEPVTTPPPEEQPISRGHARYVLGVLFVVYIFNFMDRQILTAVLEPLRKELGATDWHMGLLTGSFALVYTIAGLPLARWADTGSRTLIISLGLAVWSAMTAVCGLTRSFMQLLFARLGVGLGEASCSPASHSLISDYFPPERRSKAMAIYSIGANFGMFFGMIVGAWVAQNYGWRAAFLVVGLPGLAVALIVKFTVKEPPRGMSEARQNKVANLNVKQVIGYLFGLKSFRRLNLAAGIAALAGFGLVSFCNTFFMRVHEMSILEAGQVAGVVYGIGGTIGTIIGGVVGDKLVKRDQRWSLWLCSIGMLGTLPFVTMYLLVPSGMQAALLLGISVVLGMIYMAPTMAMIQGLAQLRMRAMASAIFLFVINLFGMGLGPTVVGGISTLLEPSMGEQEALRYGMLSMCIPIVISGFLYLWATRTLREDLIKSAQG